MSSLQETLPALSALVPQIPVKVRELLEAAQAVDRAGVEFLNDLESQRGEAAETVAGLHQALADLSDSATDGQSHLEGATSAVEHAHEQASSSLDEQAQALRSGVAAAREGMESLEQELLNAATGVRDGESDVKDALGQLDQSAGSAADALEASLQSALLELQSFDGAVTQVKGRLAQGLASVESAVRGTLEGAQRRLQATLETLQQLADGLSDQVRAQAELIDDRKNEIAAEVRDLIHNEVAAKVKEAVIGAHDAVDALKDVALEAARETQAASEALEARFGELRQGLEPLPADIERLKQAANDVSVSWS